MRRRRKIFGAFCDRGLPRCMIFFSGSTFWKNYMILDEIPGRTIFIFVKLDSLLRSARIWALATLGFVPFHSIYLYFLFKCITQLSLTIGPPQAKNFWSLLIVEEIWGILHFSWKFVEVSKMMPQISSSILHLDLHPHHPVLFNYVQNGQKMQNLRERPHLKLRMDDLDSCARYVKKIFWVELLKHRCQ